MNGRDVVRLVLLSAPRRPIVTKHAHRTSGVPLRVNCSCATRKQLRGPLLSVKNASPCADLELATHSPCRRDRGTSRRRRGRLERGPYIEFGCEPRSGPLQGDSTLSEA